MKNEVCEKMGVKPDIPLQNSKLGIAIETIGEIPIHGARHLPENGTNGWYIWCGELNLDQDDFYKPLHIEHIDEYLPMVREYLDLPPGYRFLIDENGYEDIWFDDQLIAT